MFLEYGDVGVGRVVARSRQLDLEIARLRGLEIAGE
jgi:hypothetical protein